jgi:hypothetical protein
LKKLIFAISVLLALTQNEKLFSQWDQPLDSGYYNDEGSVRMIEYYKHFIEGRLDTNRLYDSLYMQQVTDFICSKGAHINKIWYEVPVGAIRIILPDSLDALDMIDVFMQSELFLLIYPIIPIRINSNPGGQRISDSAAACA